MIEFLSSSSRTRAESATKGGEVVSGKSSGSIDLGSDVVVDVEFSSSSQSFESIDDSGLVVGGASGSGPFAWRRMLTRFASGGAGCTPSRFCRSASVGG